MKRIIPLFLLLSTITTFAQISTRQLPSSEPAAPKPVVYDSTESLVNSIDIQRYVGQEIFFLPKQVTDESKMKITASYKYIHTKIPECYRYINKRDQYKPIEENGTYGTQYDAVAGKYFKIIEVIDRSTVSDGEGKGLYLKLQQNESKEIAYLDVYKYEYTDQYKYAEYIIAGSFIKLQQMYLNNIFYVRPGVNKSAEDINTAENVKLEEGDVWTCTDVTLTPYYTNNVYRPTIIFKNTAGKEVAFQLRINLDSKEVDNTFISKSKKQQLDNEKLKEDSLERIRQKELAAANAKQLAEDKAAYIKDYGTKYGTLVADGNVAIGMTKEMCVAAWGRPTNVNTTTNAYGTRDQYVYRDKNAYLYFENGKLVTIQK